MRKKTRKAIEKQPDGHYRAVIGERIIGFIDKIEDSWVVTHFTPDCLFGNADWRKHFDTLNEAKIAVFE